MNNIMQISLDQIDLTDETRLRESDNLELVEEYAETLRQHMKKGKLTEYPFPPGSAYKRTDGKYVLTAGRHRGLAAVQVDLKEIPCVIYSDENEAVWAGLGDNRKNGLRNSPGDLKKMITTALQKYKELSNRDIAKHIGCSASSVDQVARELRKNTQESNQSEKEEKTAGEKNQQESVPPQSPIPPASDSSEGGAKIPDTKDVDVQSSPPKTGQQAADNSGEGLSSDSDTAPPDGQTIKPAQKSGKKPEDETPNADPPGVETPGSADPSNSDVDEQVSEDRVEALLVQVRKGYDGFTKDEKSIFADGLYQFLCDIDYLESEVGSEENDAESDDETESEAEANADGGDADDDDIFDQSDMLKANDEETAED